MVRLRDMATTDRRLTISKDHRREVTAARTIKARPRADPDRAIKVPRPDLRTDHTIRRTA
jgi:hypothetical protein